MDYRILPPEELIEEGVVTLPLSKSIMNRRLMLAALTPGEPLPPARDDECLDIEVMRSAVAAITSSQGGRVEVNAGESGTALRFLCSLAAVTPGCDVVITGQPGLLRRPVGDLVEALRLCGATIEYLDGDGHAPLRVVGGGLKGGEVSIDPTVSSQFVSSLLMVAPLMSEGLRLRFLGEPVSLPYIKMTVAMMRRRGVSVELAPLMAEVTPGSYKPVKADDEADWSAAAFWYEVVALTAGWITLKGKDDVPFPLPADSVQGDARAAEFFECLGVLTEGSEDIPGGVALSPSPEVFGRLDLDLQDYPDLAPALTVTCCMLGVPFRFVGLKSLSIKETDRLKALVEEMDKVGCSLETIRDYGLEWEGKRHPIASLPEFDPRGDHRLAMAFAPVAAYIPGIVVKDAGCVAKSYPGYWDDLRSLGFQTLDPSEHMPDSGEGE